MGTDTLHPSFMRVRRFDVITTHTHTKSTITSSSLQDGGVLTTCCCSILPTFRNQIYPSPWRHLLTMYFQKILFFKMFKNNYFKIFWVLSRGSRGSRPYFRIPLLPLRVPIIFPAFRPHFLLPSSRYFLPSTSWSSQYFP